MIKLVQCRPGRKLWEVKVTGPTIMSPWMPSAIQVQQRKVVPPQLIVAVAFEWPGYSLVHGKVTHPSEFLENIRLEAEQAYFELCDTLPDGEEGYWEVQVPCAGCQGRGYLDCGYCDGTGEVRDSKDKEECEECDGDGTRACYECDGEAFWYVDYEPGLEHWPGPTAAWAAEARSGRDG
jgi:hypothetical protein